MKAEKKYWFHAKRYGWGWGLPAVWQGWVVVALFAGLAVAGIFIFPPRHDPGELILYMLALNIGLLSICWLKGEPPKWRWDDK